MSSRKKRILFIVQHRFNRSPGQRYRCEQYIPYLEKAGFECVYSPILINETEDKNFYSAGKYFSKLLLLLRGILRRTRDVLRAKNFDIIFIYREAFMTGTVLFEKLIHRAGDKIIFDFDDAIWNHDISEANKKLSFLKRPEKTEEIIALADLVFAGNNYLAEYSRKFNNHVAVVPSTINLEQYKIQEKKNSGEVVIGWSGSYTTIEHFKPIIPVLKKLKEKYSQRILFRVFGAHHFQNDELGIDGIEWTPENEVEEISKFDIGIMPLPDTEWTRGKCGMKGLQYMALEVATVMSAVGVNTEIIQDGVNGFLVKNDDEWFEKLSRLIESAALREQLGKAGRKTIEEKYSCQSQHEKYVNHFRKLLSE